MKRCNKERKEGFMLGVEGNVVDVREEDREFIRALMLISPEKKILLQGILIGMDLQESQETMEKHSQNAESISK